MGGGVRTMRRLNVEGTGSGGMGCWQGEEAAPGRALWGPRSHVHTPHTWPVLWTKTVPETCLMRRWTPERKNKWI